MVLQEKSLGGLCRRFVQLFLVGNEIVSVGEAAEKLSDPIDVSTAIASAACSDGHAVLSKPFRRRPLVVRDPMGVLHGVFVVFVWIC